VRRLLLVEDDDRQRQTIVELVGEGDDVEVTAVRTAEEAAAALDSGEFDCLVADLMLPGEDGIQFLEKVRAANGKARELPIIVYTGKDLTTEDEEALKKVAQSVIPKSAIHSPERLLSETALFLHRVESDLPERSKAVLESSRSQASVAGRKVLVVDDDVRNIFAMTSVLEASGLEVIYAENGQAGIDALTKDPTIDVVLMDVMMPGMDGYETMRAIRANPSFRGIPIIAITAKALKDDRKKCLEAGASDYLPKPVDTEKLLDLIRLWTGNGEVVALQ